MARGLFLAVDHWRPFSDHVPSIFLPFRANHTGGSLLRPPELLVARGRFDFLEQLSGVELSVVDRGIRCGDPREVSLSRGYVNVFEESL